MSRLREACLQEYSNRNSIAATYERNPSAAVENRGSTVRRIYMKFL